MSSRRNASASRAGTAVRGLGYNAGLILAAVGELTCGYLVKDAYHDDSARMMGTIALVYVAGWW